MSLKFELFLIGFMCSVTYCLSQKTETPVEHHFFNDLKTEDNPGYWINLPTRKEDPKKPGNFYSMIDAKNPYSYGFEAELPADLQKKNINLLIKARLIIADTTQNLQLVINLTRGDSTIIWRGTNIAAFFGKVDKWVDIRDSLLIPANLTSGTKLKIYLWNQDGKFEAGIDDLDIQLAVFKTPSYLVH